MSENMPAHGADEFYDEPHLVTPNQVIHEYLQLGPLDPMGTVPVMQLGAWNTVLSNAHELTPEQRYHAGWINVEHAYSQFFEDRPGKTLRIKEGLNTARSHFNAIRQNTNIDRTLGAQALSAAGAVDMYGVLLDYEAGADDLKAAHNTMFSAYLASAKELLASYEHFNTMDDIPNLHAMIAAMTISLYINEGTYCLPAPSRATMAANTKSAWSLLYWDVETGGILPVRVAATGPPELTVLSPVLLQNSQYLSKHGQGTLQAIIDAAGVKNAFKNAPQAARQIKGRRNSAVLLDQRHSQAINHLSGTRDNLLTAITEQATARASAAAAAAQAEKIANASPEQAYLYLDPHLHSTALDQDLLEDFIGKLEMSYAADELTPEDMRLLAWMHIEAGVKSAHEGNITASLGGTFDRAEDICIDAATIYKEHEQTAPEANMMIARAASPVYKAISLDKTGEVNVEETRDAYVDDLITIGSELLEAFEQQTDLTTTEAIDLYQSLQLVTACLTVTICSHGANIAAPSTARQRGEGHDHVKGWDITVWPMTQNGTFNPDYYGRIRLADKENRASADENVLTIPGRMIDNDSSFAVLRNLIKQTEGQQIKPAAQKRIDKLAGRLLNVTDAAAW